MILPDFILPSRSNKTLLETGIDSISNCINRDYFSAYPHKVEYNYNSRGFRDTEWPETIDELKQAIWCFGDSFTVGVGSPVEHTWVNILKQRTGIRCINVSLDGASNNWIARKINRVIEEINPQHIVVQWTYLHRNESNDITLTDEDRRSQFLDNISADSQLANFANIRASINKEITESFIPDCCEFTRVSEQIKQNTNKLKGTSWPNLTDMTFNEFVTVDRTILTELKKFKVYDDFLRYFKYKELIDNLGRLEVHSIDLARDGFHYDYLTASRFVDSIISRFNESSS